MHCRKMVVKRHGLYKGVMPFVLSLNRFDECRESLVASLTPVASTMPGKAESHVFIPAPNPAWRTMIVVAADDHTSVDVTDKVFRNWVIVRHFCYPPIGLGGCAGLFLRPSEEYCGPLSGIYRLVQFSISEFGSFDSRSTGDLHLELDFLKVLNPVPLMGDGL